MMSDTSQGDAWLATDRSTDPNGTPAEPRVSCESAALNGCSLSGSPGAGESDRCFRSECSPVHDLVMLITEQCNLRCDYCYTGKRPGRMTEETAEQSIRFLLDHAPPAPQPVSVTYFGGEPLLEPDLIEFVHERLTQEAASEGREAKFSMTTNATLLNRRNAEMIERLGIGVRVSLDGIGESHDRHRRTIAGRGSFKLITRHLDIIRSLPAVSVRLTVSPETAAELPASIEWLINEGFGRIAFSPVIEAEWSEDALAHLLVAEQALNSLDARSLDKISHITRTKERIGITAQRWGCGAARGFVAVDVAGFIYPCHRFVGYSRNGEAQRIGHVATGFDTARREYYLAANHSTSRHGCGHGLFEESIAETDKACRSCRLLSVCGSNCMAVNEYMTGDPMRPHPINRVLAQIDVASALRRSGSTTEPCGVAP